jgi:hypothetical protein
MRGGNRKIGEREEIFLKTLALHGPMPSVGNLRIMLDSELDTKVGPTAIRRTLDRLFPKRERASVGRPSKCEANIGTNALGGFELIIALAYQLKWPSRAAKVVADAVRDQKRDQSGLIPVPRDLKGRGKSGKLRAHQISKLEDAESHGDELKTSA